MENVVEQKKVEAVTMPVSERDEYRESVKKLIDATVKSALEQEMQKAAQELIEEQRKAIRQLIEEQRAALRQIVEEEKKSIWARAEELRRQVLKLGL
jgi:uncharacterized membrane protein